MPTRILAGTIAVVLGLTAAPLNAQTVEGGVVVRSGPVAGHVVVGSPPPVVVYREPVRQIIVVERLHVPRGRAYGWWRRHGYREAWVYYDGDSYYARPFKGRPGLRRVLVYERAGRYYAWDELERRPHHRHDRDD
jgi:hypothetical protein